MEKPAIAHVLITGTTSGLGRALLEYYTSQGIEVTAVNRRTLPEVESLYPRANFHLSDVRFKQQIFDLVRTLEKKNNLPDLFILNAGINRVDNDTCFDIDVFDEAMDTNLRGILNFVVPLTRLESKSKKVTVVAISSMGADLPNPYCLGYHVSKRALTACFDVFSEMYEGTNLSFKQVLLGPVPTGILDTSSKFPKIMSDIKKIFSVSLPDAVRSLAAFSQSNRKKLVLPWRAFFLFRTIRFAQNFLPGFYRGRKTMSGSSRHSVIEPKEPVPHG